MNIETTDDLTDDLLNKMGVYGGCKNADDPEGCDETGEYCCRSGASMVLKDRIIESVKNDIKLGLLDINDLT